MLGRFIASISDLGSIFTMVLCASVNMMPWVRYIGNGSPLPYDIYYITMLIKAFMYRLNPASSCVTGYNRGVSPLGLQPSGDMNDLGYIL